MDPRLEPLRAVADPFKRRLLFVALVSELVCARGVPAPVVVGGHALETYTTGNYATRNIVVVAAYPQALRDACEGLGLERMGRHWVQAELGLAIECPSDEIPGRVAEVMVESRPIRVIAVEELLIDRLNAYVHWRSERDGDWAETLVTLYHDLVDWGYVERRAREEGVLAALGEVRSRTPRRQE